ncbi:hypothetical protein AAFF_G00414120 [Aldrovandia affinis]|uniref:Uncharacterized protein n=1 Tax=Aldrovandia affinis TaxID=143900 RepID=A0AAD7R3J8_9TELE|nr:hypothetical protein AAFF_G00414120 [Aldrovandia affinis]
MRKPPQHVPSHVRTAISSMTMEALRAATIATGTNGAKRLHRPQPGHLGGVEAWAAGEAYNTTSSQTVASADKPMTLGRLTRQPANSHLAELRVMERTHQHLQKQLREMQLLEKQVPANRGDLCDAYYERTDGYGTTGKRLKTKHDRSWQQADSGVIVIADDDDDDYDDVADAAEQTIAVQRPVAVVQEQIEYDYKPGSAVAHYAKGAFSKTLKQEAIDEVIDKPQPTRDYYTQEATRAVAGEHRKKTHKTGDNRELMQLTDARVYCA